MQRDLLAAIAFEVVDPQRVVPGSQIDGTVFRGWPVQAVVVDDQGVVDNQARPIVTDEPEGVAAGLGDVDVADDVGEEEVLEAEVSGGGPVDRRHQPVDVRGLGRLERADGVQGDL